MIALAVLFLGQIPGVPTPVAATEVAYLPGQLDVVQGPRLVHSTVMSLYYRNESQPEFTGSSVAGQTLLAYDFGWVKFATAQEDFQGVKVWHMSWSGHTNSHHGNNVFAEDANEDYWVDLDGHIRRQTAGKLSAFGGAQAICDYFPDHIRIQTQTEGKVHEQTLYPAHDEIARLNDQFKPMVVDGKIVNREKDYLYFDPFGCTFEQRSARISGRFDGKELDEKFVGYDVEIQTGKKIQHAFVSDDNDLVKVDLADHKWIIMQMLPPNRQPDAASGARIHN